MKTFQPEWRRFTDEATGTKILQWTSGEVMNHHLYFTNPSISEDGKRGYFVSYRTGYPNLFRIDLENGGLTQVSDRVDINAFSPSPSRCSPWIYASARNCVRAICSETGEDRELCRFDTGKLGNCSLNADGSLLAIALRYGDRCELAVVETATGKVEIVTKAKEVGHIQFCPIDSNLLLYSGTVTQRLWVFDRRTGENAWIYPQKEGEWIVHESWVGGSDEVIFAHWPVSMRAVRANGSGLRTVSEINAWHMCSNRSGDLFVCDTNHPDHGLVLVEPGSGMRRVLCHPKASQRGTQWSFSEPAAGAGIDTSIIRSDTPENDKPPHPDDEPSTYGPQWSHPHPSFSADGRTVIFTSDRNCWSQVYQAEISANLPLFV